MEDMPFWSIILAVLASSGFWELLKWIIQTKKKKLSSEQKLLLGIAHDRIWVLGNRYINRKGITSSEFDNLSRFATPYLEMGANGTGKKIWEEVKALPTISDAEAEKRDAIMHAQKFKEGVRYDNR